MLVDINAIHRLKDIREQIAQLTRDSEFICRPLCGNLDKVSELYGIYLDLIGRETAQSESYNRKKFILAALWIFCPKALAGGKMRSGLRRRIAELMNIRSSTSISDNCTDLLMYYTRYADFRKDVNFIIKLFVELFADSTIII